MKSYLAIGTLDQKEFDDRRVDLSNSPDATKSDENDVRKMENLLDLAEGALSNKTFYISKSDCSCGRTLTFYDFVFTSLVEQWHDPSFIAHTLVGNKRIINEPRPIRCSACGLRKGHTYIEYSNETYGCCQEFIE
ncbi:hypothetical protein [Ruegeria arenilitoris]|uniref:hypothetical protein n=1 Tax=Ruegeria arenilitoris TaxID=1173585 RepID=UPI00147E962D|nr:hypothetical protein [Ruegeria arenilitoris]